MSECDRYLEMISQMLDGELPEPQKTELLAHLDGCANCRRVYDAFNAHFPFTWGDGRAGGLRRGRDGRRAHPGRPWVKAGQEARKEPGPLHGPCRLPSPGRTGDSAAGFAVREHRRGLRRAPGRAVRHRRSSRRDRPSQFRRRCRLRRAGPLPRRGDPQREEPTADEPADGAANGVLEQAGADETPAVEQFGPPAEAPCSPRRGADHLHRDKLPRRATPPSPTRTTFWPHRLAAQSRRATRRAGRRSGRPIAASDINYAEGSSTLDVSCCGRESLCEHGRRRHVLRRGFPRRILDALD